MAIDTVEERMARVERGCERVVERLGVIEQRLTALEPRLASSVTSLRYELLTAVDAVRSDIRAGDTGLRRQATAQFYWLLMGLGGAAAVGVALAIAR